MSESVAPLGERRRSCQVGRRSTGRYRSLRMACNRRAKQRWVVQSLRKRRKGFIEQLLVGRTERRRLGGVKLSLAEFNENMAFDAGYCWRVWARL